MVTTWQDNATLPLPVRKGLEKLCAGLHEAWGDSLIAVILYGDLTRECETPRIDPLVSIMIVLDEVSVERLDEVAPVIRKATRTLGLTTMISSESDLQGSTDVFPVKFLDMQRHHVLLTGRDVLSDLSITRDHLRLRCEQEIKNLSLRLRSRYIQAHGKPKLMRRTLTRAIQPFSTSIRVLGQLKTGDEPPSDTDTLTSDAKTLDLDGHTLQEVLTLSRSKHGGRSAELKDLYGRFMRVVQQAAIIADEL